MDLKTLDLKYKVSSKDLFRGVDPAEFKPTSEVQPSTGLERIIGQREYIEPFQDALGSSRACDNVVIIAPGGHGKRLFVDLCVQDYKARTETTNVDQVSYCNFGNHSSPKVIYVKAGTARQLSQDLDQMVACIATSMNSYDMVVAMKEKNRAAIKEEVRKAKEELKDKPDDLKARLESLGKESKMYDALGRRNESEKALASRIESGYIAKIKSLGEEVSKELEHLGYTLSMNENGLGGDGIGAVNYYLAKEGKMVEPAGHPSLYRNFYDAVNKLKDDCKDELENVPKIAIIKRNIERMEFKYRDDLGVFLLLHDFEDDMLKNICKFQLRKGLFGAGELSSYLGMYSINILQDNNGRENTVPVEEADGLSIYETRGSEDAWAHKKEGHEKIIPGKFVKASGGPNGKKGILIMNNGNVLLGHPPMTSYMFGALDRGTVKPISLKGDLEPEEALANVRVVMPLSHDYAEYFLTHPANSHLASLFQRVLVFNQSMPNSSENRLELARHFRDEVGDKNLKHATPEAIAKVIEYEMSMAGKDRLSLDLDNLVDIYSRADSKAGSDNSELIDAKHVESAILSRVQERNMRERRLRDYMGQHYFPQEKEVGAVGGISVYTMGHSFGKPFRIAVQAIDNYGLGLKLMDIERGSNMAGNMAVKGMMQVEALLKKRYRTKKTPLNFDLHCSNSQEFGPFDGPSASTANAVACVSALGDIPVYPNVFFTGAIDPSTGESLPIGGLNQKVMGVIDTALNAGMKDTIVAFPKRNLDDLQLFFDKYRAAVEEGKVRVYAYGNLDEALEIAMRDDAKSVDNKVKARLKASNQAGFIGSMLKSVLGPK